MVDKPSGLLVIPDGYDLTLPTVRSVLEPDFGRLFMVHRLDKETSGILLLARNPDTHRELSIRFQKREIRKLYTAFCAGLPAWEEKVIDISLRVNGDRSHRTIQDNQHGKPAQTHVKVVRLLSNFCKVTVTPGTGYTHQIRAHLSLVGLPILGDRLYRYPRSWQGPRMDTDELPSISRLALHASQIRFKHPRTLKELHFAASLPAELQALEQE